MKKYLIVLLLSLSMIAFVVYHSYISKKCDFKIICCGDSLTRGDYGSNPPGTKNNHDQNYPYFLAKKLGISVSYKNSIDNVINLGVDGATPKTWYSKFKRNKKIFKFKNVENPIVIMMFGTNGDFTDTLDVDTNFSSFEQYNKTSVGYYCREIEEINKLSGNRAKIFLCQAPYINPNVQPEYAKNVAQSNSIITQIANKYNLPIINTYTELGISSINSHYFQPLDGIHYNEEGYKRLSNLIYSKIEDYIE